MSFFFSHCHLCVSSPSVRWGCHLLAPSFCRHPLGAGITSSCELCSRGSAQRWLTLSALQQAPISLCPSMESDIGKKIPNSWFFYGIYGAVSVQHRTAFLLLFHAKVPLTPILKNRSSHLPPQACSVIKEALCHISLMPSLGTQTGITEEKNLHLFKRQPSKSHHEQSDKLGRKSLSFCVINRKK